MRRLIALFLILLILNYIAGYYVIFWVLKRHADTELIQRLNTGKYSENQTVTFKFPFSLPYNNDWSTFERVDGSFQLQGEFFKLVKQKLERDTLYIVCIPDYSQKTISMMMADFVKLSNGMNTDSKIIKSVTSLSKDYQLSKLNWNLNDLDDLLIKYSKYQPFILLNTHIDIPHPPPKA